MIFVTLLDCIEGNLFSLNTFNFHKLEKLFFDFLEFVVEVSGIKTPRRPLQKSELLNVFCLRLVILGNKLLKSTLKGKTLVIQCSN